MRIKNYIMKGRKIMKVYNRLSVNTGDPVKSKSTATYNHPWELPPEELKVLQYLYCSHIVLSWYRENPVLLMSSATISAKTDVPLDRIPNILDVLQNSGFIKMLWRIDDKGHAHKDIYIDEKKCRGVPVYKDTPHCENKAKYVLKLAR